MVVKNVTTRVSNPFGMRAPRFVRNGERRAVYGYGDANADFHVIGDHPGVHGGLDSGVPFTGSDAFDPLWTVLHDVGFASESDGEPPTLSNCYVSYLHASTTEDGVDPTPEQYARLEPFFDAELRAINAHVLLPVGPRAIEHVLAEYTTQAYRYDDLDALHGQEIRGRGFLVIPVRDPADWGETDADTLRRTLRDLLRSDYRQTKGVATLVG